ncbi:hypothetical protein Efla_002014 [Eimeria flavescens]
MELQSRGGAQFSEEEGLSQCLPALFAEGPLDPATSASNKIVECRRQIAALTRQLRRQQHMRASNIVQRIMQEELTSARQEQADAAAGRKRSAFKRTHLPTVTTGRRLESALQEQRRSLFEGTPQRVAGRVYDGPSFRCRPAKVIFDGFEAGKVYSQKVELTNVSLGFSTFRVLPLPEELQDVLAVGFEPPGRMSAGRSTHLTITFTPKNEEDLRSEVLLLSPTGPQSLPIVCCRKRSILTFHPPQQSAHTLLKTLESDESSFGKSEGVQSELMHKADLTKQAKESAQGRPPRTTQKNEPRAEGPCSGGVIYLTSGEVQLGEVAVVRFRLRNIGSLSTAYHLYPVSPETAGPLPEACAPSAQQQTKPPDDATDSLHNSQEDAPVDSRSVEALSRRIATETSSSSLADGDFSAGQATEQISLSAAGWLEALKGEAVVLAQRLRASAKQNSLSWEKIESHGLARLLYKGNDGKASKVCQTSRPLVLSLERTLVQNAAGELGEGQVQDVSIVHAPTSTGRFIGFFSLQFSDPEVPTAHTQTVATIVEPNLRLLSRSRLLEHDELMVVMDGQCVLPLVCVDSPEHDLGICVPDRVYRQQFHVKSSSTLTRVLQVVSPKAEAGTLWVEPARSFVQPQGVTSLTANLCLSFSFFERHPEYVQPLPAVVAERNLESVAFRIPVHIKASDQVLCAETAITGILTEHTIVLSSMVLNFGQADNIARRMRFLKVYNPSLLIAQYVFRSSHRALKILEPPHPCDLRGSTKQTSVASCAYCFLQQSEEALGAWEQFYHQLPPLDFDGTGFLLPGETRTLALVLNPREFRSDSHALQLASGKAVEREGVLRMRVLVADQAAYEVTIPWTATIVESPIAVVPSPTLMLPAIPHGQSTSATLELKLTTSQLLAGGGECPGSRPQIICSDAASKKASHWAAVLIQIKKPPSHLSAINITPLEVFLDAKKRSSSLYIQFAPTQQYMQMCGQQTKAQASNPDWEATRQFLFSAPAECGSRDADTKKQSGRKGAREGQAQTPSSSTTTKGRDNSRKGDKAEEIAAADSKAMSDRSRTQGDSKAKSNKSDSKYATSGGDVGDAAGGDFQEPSAETHADTASPAAMLANGEMAFCQKSQAGTSASSVKSILSEVAAAGGSRWTSQEDGNGGVFRFDSPLAYHHGRWLIPLRICRLTGKQVEAFLSGEENVLSGLLPGSITHSFIEVTTCATPSLVVASSQHVQFGSVMVGQRVCQHVVLACAPGVGPYCHKFKAFPFSPGSAFSLVSAAREAGPERPLSLTVCFQPNAAKASGSPIDWLCCGDSDCMRLQAFSAELKLVSARTRIALPLSGFGVEHTIDVVPDQSAYDMGAVACMTQIAGSGHPSSTTCSVALKNRTSTPLPFNLLSKQSRYPQLDCARAGTGLNYFVCKPDRGVIPGLGSRTRPVFFAEGWLQQDFELAFTVDGHASRILTVFGLATSCPLYASLPALSSGAVSLQAPSGCPVQPADSGADNSCSCCGAIDVGRQAISDEVCRRGLLCPACYTQSLPRLSADRGFLCNMQLSSPRYHSTGDEAYSAGKSRGSQQNQLGGVSQGTDKKLQDAEQVIEVTFDSPIFRRASLPSPDCPPSAAPSDRPSFSSSSNQKQSTRTNPTSSRDDKPKSEQKADAGAVLQEPEVIVENETTRLILIGGAWIPGRQGLPPYALIRGEVSGTFEITMDSSKHSHMFALNPTKGTLFLGSRQMIRATFTPQAAVPAGFTRGETTGVPPGSLKPQQVNATAKLSLRGVAGATQAQERTFEQLGI